MPPLETRLRTLRVIHLVLVATIPMYAVAGEMLTREAMDVSLMHKGLLVVLMSELGVLTLIRTRWIAPAVEALRLKPDDAEALQRWHGGNVTCFVLCEAIALLGFALRFLGGTLMQAAPFYAVGFVLLLFLVPRNPANQ